MEKLLEKLFAGLGWEIFLWLTLLGVGFVISFLLHRKPIREMRQELAELKRAREQTEATPEQEQEASNSVGYFEVCEIIDLYIKPATRDMPRITQGAVRKDFIDRFSKMVGAKLGEYEYNRVLLNQWMQSNAARFLVEHRHEMI
ncbi:MAG: hypothetical protein OXM87_13775 [Truepera sp.]|nr:hypothetical protein [Truepera sp.]